MADPSETVLFLRDEGRRGPASSSGLPPDLVAQSAHRLRVLALLYAFMFFMAAFLPALLLPEIRAQVRFENWALGAIAITVALLVAIAARSPRIPVSWIVYLGLGFEVVSSYGIAAAEFLDPTSVDFDTRWLGLSWVAVWTLLFAVVVPSRPGQTVIATLASVSSVPLVILWVAWRHDLPGVTPQKVFFGLVFPYLLVTVMAYVGARVIHTLGKEVTRARELGGYQLIERLGAGGMGEVWRARHHLLVRPAAIKLVRPEFAVAGNASRLRQLRARFAREAQATASMRSPHTVALYDFGVSNDGTFYYVMELLDGFDVQTLVERFGPLPAERAIGLLKQVCHSLSEAHGAGLIHRDVKPANIYVCRYGRDVDFVKVLDFGMVKSDRDDDGAQAQLTADNVVWGTPAFMAPEQVLGSRAVDARTDLYAVGCVAYWMVTAQRVFPGQNAMEIMMHHAQTAPVRPSARTELEIPAALDDLVLACLAKNPDDRPASADALAAALAAIPTRSSWTGSRVEEWWARHHPATAEDAS